MPAWGVDYDPFSDVFSRDPGPDVHSGDGVSPVWDRTVDKRPRSLRQNVARVFEVRMMQGAKTRVIFVLASPEMT